MKITKIISGGQTGADRAGLDFALRHGIPIGGWCPSGRRAEDGEIPAVYPLVETLGYSYLVRTRLNVRHSDFTVIFASPLTPGSRLTLRECQRALKQHIWLNGFPNDASLDAERLVSALYGFQGVLNVAGSRESKCPGIHDYVVGVLACLVTPVLKT